MTSFVDTIDLLDQPGESLDAPDDPNAPTHHSPLWSAVAMMGILAVGGVIGEFSTTYSEQLPPSTASPTLSGYQVEQLCRDQMVNLGIQRYSVPAYVPDGDGDNVQTAPPWRPGMRVKVVPDRARAANPDASAAAVTVACVIPVK